MLRISEKVLATVDRFTQYGFLNLLVNKIVKRIAPSLSASASNHADCTSQCASQCSNGTLLITYLVYTGPWGGYRCYCTRAAGTC